MCRRFETIEQPCLAEDQGARADRQDQLGLNSATANPIDEPIVVHLATRPPTPRHDEYIGPRSIAERVLRVHTQGVASQDRSGLGRNRVNAKRLLRRVSPGHAEYLEGSAEVEDFDVVENEDTDVSLVAHGTYFYSDSAEVTHLGERRRYFLSLLSYRAASV